MKTFLAIASIVFLVASVAVVTTPPAVAKGKAVQSVTDVNVVNTPFVRVRHAKLPAYYRDGIYLDKNFYGASTDPYTVPAGKQLVVENASVLSSSSSLQHVSVFVWTGGVATTVGYLPIGPLVNGWRATNVPFSLRVSEGDQVRISCRRSTATVGEFIYFNLTGYLEPAR